MSFQKYSFQKELENCNFLPNRTPATTEDGGAFKKVVDYQEGDVWVGHFAGESEWEFHHSDAIVYVLGGEAKMFQILNGEKVSQTLQAGELTIVPKGVWHKFLVANEVKIMTITTKQPSEYSIEMPESTESCAAL